MEWARTTVRLLEVYGVVGLAVAIPFVLVGAGRVVAGARGAGPLFRLTILPGAVVLWPVVLVRWVAALRSRPRAEGAS